MIGGGARSRVRYIPVLDGATSRRDRCRTGNESHPNAGLDKGRWRSGFIVYRTGSRSTMMTGEVSLGNMTRLKECSLRLGRPRVFQCLWAVLLPDPASNALQGHARGHCFATRLESGCWVGPLVGWTSSSFAYHPVTVQSSASQVNNSSWPTLSLQNENEKVAVFEPRPTLPARRSRLAPLHDRYVSLMLDVSLTCPGDDPPAPTPTLPISGSSRASL